MHGLSLRSIARDMGMVSSAIYRYFASRDELLTALIIDAYHELGEAAEAADRAESREDLLARWQAIAHGARAWAMANPAQYALLFGTPVPGYAAPTDTIDPAGRFTNLLLAILAEAEAAGRRFDMTPVSPELAASYETLRLQPGISLSDAALLAGMTAWVGLFGAISFELFGHLNNVVYDRAAFFDAVVLRLGMAAIGTAPALD